MKKFLSPFLLPVIFLASCTLLLVSCSTRTQYPTDDSYPLNTMIVTVDGVGYTWTATAQRVFIPITGTSYISVAGSTGNGKIVSFSLSNISNAGTYKIGLRDTSSARISATMIYQADLSNAYSSPEDTVSVGDLTIQELTTTSIKATFNGTLKRFKGTDGDSITVITHGFVNATIH